MNVDNGLEKNAEKTNFMQHFATVFQPKDILSNVDTTLIYQPPRHINTNIKPKKVSGTDEISPGLLKKLTRNTVVMKIYLFNSCSRINHVAECFKTAKIIMLKKTDKSTEQVTWYIPTLLLALLSKLFEKLQLKRLKPINIPDF